MNIMLGINTLEVGGAQNFILQLSKAFSEAGHKVFIFNLFNKSTNDSRIKKFLGAEFNKIKIISLYEPGQLYNFFLWKLSGALSKFGIKQYHDKIIIKRQLKKFRLFLKKEKIDVVNTHLWEVSEFISKNSMIPHVITMHGSFEYFINNGIMDEWVEKIIEPEKIKRAEFVIKKSRHIIYIADKNLEILNFFESKNILREKIYLGFPKKNIVKELKPSGNDFIFGMIARGMESKGWEIAIKAFIELKGKYDNCKLYLAYTDSEFMSTLKGEYQNINGLLFKGFVDEPEAFMNSIDSLLLPTWDDCLPLSIIEALSNNVPVISTNVGEIPFMISNEVKIAGIIVPLNTKSKTPDVDAFFKAMSSYLDGSGLYLTHKQNTGFVSKNFDMEICINKYISFYKKAIAGIHTKTH